MAVRNEHVFYFGKIHTQIERAIVAVGRKLDQKIVVDKQLAARTVDFPLARLSAQLTFAKQCGYAFRRSAAQKSYFH